MSDPLDAIQRELGTRSVARFDALIKTIEGDPALAAALCGSIWLHPNGRIGLQHAGVIRQRVQPTRRGQVALTAARAAGLLDDIEALDLDALGPLLHLGPLAGLPALRRLKLSDANRITESSSLSALTGLEHLRLSLNCVRGDLAPLAPLRALRALHLLCGHHLKDLSPLSQMAALEALEIQPAGILRDLSPLSGLLRLRLLVIRQPDLLEDLSPLRALTSLRELDLRRAIHLRDLRPLGGLDGLESLTLSSAHRLTTLDGLQGMTGLRSLDIRDCPALADVSALHGLSGLAEGLTRGDDGALRRDGAPLKGHESFIAVNIDGPHLDGLRALDLSGCVAVRDLRRLVHLQRLERLNLSRCALLEETWPLVHLGALSHLRLDQTPATPSPERRLMEARADVEGYQRRLARALKAESPRGEKRTALQAAEAAGYLQRQRVSDEERERRALLKRIRRFIAAPDIDDARQGYALLGALGDPEMIADLRKGVSLEEGQLRISEGAKRRAHLRRRRRALWAALTTLGLAGELERAERIEARDAHLPLCDLEPLRDLTALRHLRLENIGPAEDLSPLETLTALETLHLRALGSVKDLSPLGTLSALRTLDLHQCGALDTLDVLIGLRQLTSLRVEGAWGLSDTSALLQLPQLRALHIQGNRDGVDLSALSSIVALERLELPWCWSLSSLDGIEAHASLRSLDLSGSTNTADITPLLALPALETLRLQGSRQPISRGFVERLLEGAPRLEVLDLFGGYDAPPELARCFTSRAEILEALAAEA